MSSNEPRDQLAEIIERDTCMPFTSKMAAASILASPELLDMLTTYRQAQRLAEHAVPGGESLQDRWRQASAAARKSEHHWPADCLAEAADVLDQMEGWRPPPRVIESIADLSTLPDETMLRTRLGYAAIIGTHSEHGRGAYMTNLEGLRMLSDNDLPATVLWEPEEADQ
jgi:hypothetical protein